MASTRQQNYPHATQQYPHFTGFYGYIQPFNDGTQAKILRTDGTLHVAQVNEQCMSNYPHFSPCKCQGGPYTIQNWQQPAGLMRWCPSDSNTQPCKNIF